MIKLVVVGLWASVISVGAAYVTGSLVVTKPKASGASSAPSIISVKTKEITIPVIKDGQLKGYAVAQFSFDENSTLAAGLITPPELQVVDAAYRLLYNDDSLNFTDLKRIDLDNLTGSIEKNVNGALKREVVSHVAIQELTLFTRGQADKQM